MDNSIFDYEHYDEVKQCVDQYVMENEKQLKERNDLIFSFIDLSVKDDDGIWSQESVKVLISPEDYDKLSKLGIISEPIPALEDLSECLREKYPLGRCIDVAQLEVEEC